MKTEGGGQNITLRDPALQPPPALAAPDYYWMWLDWRASQSAVFLKYCAVDIANKSDQTLYIYVKKKVCTLLQTRGALGSYLMLQDPHSIAGELGRATMRTGAAGVIHFDMS